MATATDLAVAFVGSRRLGDRVDHGEAARAAAVLSGPSTPMGLWLRGSSLLRNGEAWHIADIRRLDVDDGDLYVADRTATGGTRRRRGSLTATRRRRPRRARAAASGAAAAERRQTRRASAADVGPGVKSLNPAAVAAAVAGRDSGLAGGPAEGGAASACAAACAAGNRQGGCRRASKTGRRRTKPCVLERRRGWRDRATAAVAGGAASTLATGSSASKERGGHRRPASPGGGEGDGGSWEAPRTKVATCAHAGRRPTTGRT